MKQVSPAWSAGNKPSNEHARRTLKGVFTSWGFGDPKFRQSMRKIPAWALRRRRHLLIATPLLQAEEMH
jgi:hypothetical protein